SDPARDATTTRSRPFSMYRTGVVRVRPVLRPTCSSSRTGAPLTVPATRPRLHLYRSTFRSMTRRTSLSLNEPGGGNGGGAGIGAAAYRQHHGAAPESVTSASAAARASCHNRGPSAMRVLLLHNRYRSL